MTFIFPVKYFNICGCSHSKLPIGYFLKCLFYGWVDKVKRKLIKVAIMYVCLSECASICQTIGDG